MSDVLATSAQPAVTRRTAIATGAALLLAPRAPSAIAAPTAPVAAASTPAIPTDQWCTADAMESSCDGFGAPVEPSPSDWVRRLADGSGHVLRHPYGDEGEEEDLLAERPRLADGETVSMWAARDLGEGDLVLHGFDADLNEEPEPIVAPPRPATGPGEDLMIGLVADPQSCVTSIYELVDEYGLEPGTHRIRFWSWREVRCRFSAADGSLTPVEGRPTGS